MAKDCVMNKYPDLHLSRMLASLIKRKGITITSLSRLTQVPLQTLHGWLQGNEPKSLRQVKKVADHLNVSLDYLCFGIEFLEINKMLIYEQFNAGTFEVIFKKIK